MSNKKVIMLYQESFTNKLDKNRGDVYLCIFTPFLLTIYSFDHEDRGRDGFIYIMSY